MRYLRNFFLILLMLGIVSGSVFALTKTWTNPTISYPSHYDMADQLNYTGSGNTNTTLTGTNLSIVNIGTGCSKTLYSFDWVDSSPYPVVNQSIDEGAIYGCNDSMRIWYSTNGADYTATSWSSENATSISLSSLNGVYFKPEYRALVNASDVSTVYCSLTGLTLTYEGCLSDTLEGLPSTGSQVGGFLTALAPGVGAFILIIGIFGAIGGLLYAIVGIIKSKISGPGSGGGEM